jgi:hypothetical protein
MKGDNLMLVQSGGNTERTVVRLMINALFLLATIALTILAMHKTAIASQLTQQTVQDDLVIELMQTGVGHKSDIVEGVLVFRVRALDPAEGNKDGDGITYVDMIILDEDGNEVYRKRETASGYCAFGGGAPNCTVWDFGEHDDSWPSGAPLNEGEHTLRARADDGRILMQDFIVDIFLLN